MNKNMPLPSITFIPYNDFYISCILAGGKDYQFALAENFIRCYADERPDSDWIDYYNSHKFENYRVFKGFDFTSDNIKNQSIEFSDVITHYLKLGYVLIYNVDSFYIRCYVASNHVHSIHSMMIYDYDEQGNFMCRDYFDFTNYSEKSVPKSEINTSYKEVYEKENNYNNFMLTGVKLDNYMLSYSPFHIQAPCEQTEPKVNLEKILFLLKEFMNGDDYEKYSLNYMLYFESKYKMGINTFDCIIDKLLFWFTQRIDLVNARLIKFVEHHVFMMKERIRILKCEYGISLSDELLEHATELVKKAQQFTFMVIKTSVKRKESEMLRTVAFLDELKFEYIALIKEFIKQMECEIAMRNK